MAKDYGADRMVEQMSQPYADVKKNVEEMKASGKYSEVEMTSNGGIYAVVSMRLRKAKPATNLRRRKPPNTWPMLDTR